jgi:hypothetical protein
VALLSYLREGAARAEHRREAIQRALDLYDNARAEGRPSAEVGSFGLLVLQRALLAVEDVGVLLHAFAGEDPWERLRSARIPDLQRAFERAVTDTESVLTEAFVLATEELLAREDVTEEQRAALRRLRAKAAERWGGMLARIVEWWVRHFNIAKATMHGFPFVAGELVVESPGAGVLGAGIRYPTAPFAVAVTSRDSGVETIASEPGPDGEPVVQREIVTTNTPVSLSPDDVAGYVRTGRLAARLAAEFCEHHGESIINQHVGGIPLRGAKFLDDHQRRAIEALQRDA